MQVVLVGGGHIGLPTALSFARNGRRCVVHDTDAARIAALAEGRIPFFEPGLDELIAAEVAAGRIVGTTDPTEAYRGADVAFICVDTPMGPDGHADLRALLNAAETIAATAPAGIVAVTKSTVPLGTGERLRALFAERGADVAVASNPEFLQEGLALQEALAPTRILVGSDAPRALELLRELYAPFVAAGAAWVETDLATAELTKYASNAFLAMKISYANALAEICEAAGADVGTLTGTLGLDPRIGPGHLQPGIGYGGGCLSKDLSALRSTLAELGLKVGLLDEVEAINERALGAVLGKVREGLGDLRERRVTLLGLAFKPGTDDVRMAPALRLASALLDAGAIVTGYDPEAGPNAVRELTALRVEDDPVRAVEGAECAVVCTEWEQIRALDPARLRGAMARPFVVDGRGALDAAAFAAAGVEVVSVGRPAADRTAEGILT
ncbi:MAG TPA: UDP-glucose/GDP-mannose dehydrogenase family protein [Actinomycetota bacterium]|nr:UDP-glucose/GDP-mannose dehydrogenase family protein [Actinomycetota bacterium]